MDLYRYFHPHHNPRLRKVGIRLQELAELEQAAEELKRALHRAQIRTSSSPVNPLQEEHFTEIVTAMDYVVDSLHTLHQAHPGDDWKTMAQILEERKTTPGWENWSRLLLERLHLIGEDPNFSDRDLPGGTANEVTDSNDVITDTQSSAAVSSSSHVSGSNTEKSE